MGLYTGAVLGGCTTSLAVAAGVDDCVIAGRDHQTRLTPTLSSPPRAKNQTYPNTNMTGEGGRALQGIV